MEFLNRSATLTGEKVVSRESNEMEEAIVRIIQKIERPPSEGVVWNRLKGKANGWDRDDFRKKIEVLENQGVLLSKIHQGKRGPKTKVYAVAPEALVTYELNN